MHHFAGGDRVTLNRFVAASVGTLAVTVASARAAAAARMFVGFVVVTRGARIGVN